MINGVVMRQRSEVNSGQRLRVARERLGLGTNELTRLAKISQGIVTRIEKGEARRTSAEVMTALARALQVHNEWLMHGTGPMLLDEPPQRVVEYISRYPNLDLAIAFAEQSGTIPQAVIDHMRTSAPELSRDTDPSPGEWYEYMQSLAREWRFEGKDPGAVAKERELAAASGDAMIAQAKADRAAARAEALAQARGEAGEAPAEEAKGPSGKKGGRRT